MCRDGEERTEESDVDGDALRALARRRGTSESEAARAATAAALATADMLAAFEELHDMNAFADFEALYPRLDEDIDDSAPG